jgi:hypothetical protein
MINEVPKAHTNNRSERFYEAACHCLARYEFKLSPPTFINGVRYSTIAGIHRTDEEVFEQAWGVEVAGQVIRILRRKP